MGTPCRIASDLANDSLGDIWCEPARIIERAKDGPMQDLVSAIELTNNDHFVVKPLYSAFEQTPLHHVLHSADVNQVIVAGSATEHCVAQTAISASERDFDCVVVAGACATIDERDEHLALGYLEGVARVTVVRSAASAARLIAMEDDGKHPDPLFESRNNDTGVARFASREVRS